MFASDSLFFPPVSLSLWITVYVTVETHIKSEDFLKLTNTLQCSLITPSDLFKICFRLADSPRLILDFIKTLHALIQNT